MILAALAVLLFLVSNHEPAPEPYPLDVVVVVEEAVCPMADLADITFTTTTIAYEPTTSTVPVSASGTVPGIGCVVRFTPTLEQGEMYDLHIAYDRDQRAVEVQLGSVTVEIGGPPPTTHVYFVSEDDVTVVAPATPAP